MEKNGSSVRLSAADRRLFAACDALDPEAVRQALEAGANVNAVDPKYHLLPIDVVAEFAPEAECFPRFQARIRRILCELLFHAACPDGAAGFLGDGTRETPLAVFERDAPGDFCGELLECAGGHRRIPDAGKQSAERLLIK